MIVFDGYPDKNNENSIKSAERFRRMKNCPTAEIAFDETMKTTTSQAKFLANESNKSRLISMLCNRFKNEGIVVKQALEDADTLIINTALDMSNKFGSVVIVGEDIDLLVILTGLCKSENNIYFLKQGKGKAGNILYSPAASNLDPAVKENILFLHAFSGCDTTSAIYRQGKMKFLKVLRNQPSLKTAIYCFKDPNATPESITKAGIQFLMALYGAKSDDTSLHTYRHQFFAQSITKSLFNLASLPPTEDAARMHSFRTYLQAQKWYGNEKSPTDWGWKQSPNGLMPIPMLQDAAPQELLKMISCKCRKGCNAACSCRKAGLHCSVVCGSCQGRACSNSETIIEDPGDDEEIDSRLEELMTDENVEEIDNEQEPDEQFDEENIDEPIDQPSTSKKSRM